MFSFKLMSGLVRVLVEKIWQPPTTHMLHVHCTVYNIAMSENAYILIKQLWGLYIRIRYALIDRLKNMCALESR